MYEKYEKQKKKLESAIEFYNNRIAKMGQEMTEKGFLQFKGDINITTSYLIQNQYKSLNDWCVTMTDLLNRINDNYALMNRLYQNKE